MLTPPWDHNTDEDLDDDFVELKTSYSKQHYAQHLLAKGTVSYSGQHISIDGAGLRDHSWGPRDFTKMGHTTWIHGRIPEEGRAFSVAACAAWSGPAWLR